MRDFNHRPTAPGRTFSYEDGKGYRGYHLDVEAAKSHVKYKQDIDDYRRGKDWRYVGSIPMETVVKYQMQLPEEQQHDFWHRFATDKLTKKAFLRWFRKHYPELLPGHSK